MPMTPEEAEKRSASYSEVYAKLNWNDWTNDSDGYWVCKKCGKSPEREYTTILQKYHAVFGGNFEIQQDFVLQLLLSHTRIWSDTFGISLCGDDP